MFEQDCSQQFARALGKYCCQIADGNDWEDFAKIKLDGWFEQDLPAQAAENDIDEVDCHCRDQPQQIGALNRLPNLS